MYLILDDDDVPATRRDIKILLHKLEEQTKTIIDLQNKITNIWKLCKASGIDDFTSTNEFINVNIFIHFIYFKFKNIFN